MNAYDLAMAALWGAVGADVAFTIGTMIYTEVKAAECKNLWTDIKGAIDSVPLVGSLFDTGDDLATAVLLLVNPIPPLIGVVVSPLLAYVTESIVIGVLGSMLAGVAYGTLFVVPEAMKKCK